MGQRLSSFYGFTVVGKEVEVEDGIRCVPVCPKDLVALGGGCLFVFGLRSLLLTPQLDRTRRTKYTHIYQ